MAGCDCGACPYGVPKQWKVTFAGVTNQPGCTPPDCTDVNGDYIVDLVYSSSTTCEWTLSPGPGACGYYDMPLQLILNPAGGGGQTWTLNITSFVTWNLTDSTDCLSPLSLPLSGPNYLACNWPCSAPVESGRSRRSG